MMAPTIEENVDKTTLSLENLDVEKATSLSDLLGLSPVKNDVERLTSVKTLQVIILFPNAGPRKDFKIIDAPVSSTEYGLSYINFPKSLVQLTLDHKIMGAWYPWHPR